MDYLKDAEDRLYKHKNLIKTLSNLEMRLERLKNSGPKDIKATDYTKIGRNASANDAINDFAEAQHIIKQIQKVKDEMYIIDTIINQMNEINEESAKFIKLKYFNKNTMDNIALKLGYSINSKETIYNIKNNALKTFIELYWGE